MRGLLEKALEVLTPAQLWVNPDCGLKTRQWKETEPALAAMVEAAEKAARERHRRRGRRDFRTRLARQQTILFDGAMGTMLYERGVFLNRSFEEVCLSDPRLVLGIHRDYLDAGADVITTNSWGAGIPKLRAAGLSRRSSTKSTSRAVELALPGHPGGRPVGQRLGRRFDRPARREDRARWAPWRYREAEELFERQAAVLAAAGRGPASSSRPLSTWRS